MSDETANHCDTPTCHRAPEHGSAYCDPCAEDRWHDRYGDNDEGDAA